MRVNINQFKFNFIFFYQSRFNLYKTFKNIGAVRAESFTRPKAHFADTIINGVQESRQENFIPDCTPDPTLGEALLDTEEPLNLDEDEEELLQKLATRHYYR